MRIDTNCIVYFEECSKFRLTCGGIISIKKGYIFCGIVTSESTVFSSSFKILKEALFP